jgi:hypothetical protein
MVVCSPLRRDAHDIHIMGNAGVCLVYFILQGGLRSVAVFPSVHESEFLPIRGDVGYGLCRRLWLSAARSSAICVLPTS